MKDKEREISKRKGEILNILIDHIWYTVAVRQQSYDTKKKVMFC